MDPANLPATSSAKATPPSPSPSPRNHERPSSTDSAISSRSHQEYLDSLVVPTKEEFAHIADVQAEREAEQKRRQRGLQRESVDAVVKSGPELSAESRQQSARHAPLSSRFGFGFGRRPSPVDGSLRAKAATVIQRTYRGYRARREIKGLGIDASTRWIHAIREAQWREMTTPHARSDTVADGVASPGRRGTGGGTVGNRSSLARQNWKKVSTIARHAGADVDADASSSSDDSSSDSESSDSGKSREQKKRERKRRKEAKARRKQEAKMMGLQYFLEMVDLKHRYGSNLRVYHEEWKRAETNENFFYWLDYGEGKNLDIDACPREQLEREQVRYLSREERQYYLVKVDDEGRLCWAKNGARIDTSEKWKDSIHGIVPSEDPTPSYAPLSENRTTLLGDATTDSSHSSRSLSSSSSSADSSITSANAARYTDPYNTSSTKKISHHLSGATILNKLLRKTVRKNTWIFVADTSFRLYVGIKNSGAFQHSSFLQGSRISAAGLIRIRDGRLTSLSPLSGHYRPPASNFRAFIKSLKEADVDMGRVSVSKSYAVLVGLEVYIKARKKAEDLVGRVIKGGHRGEKRKLAGGKVVPAAAPHPTAQESESQKKHDGETERSGTGMGTGTTSQPGTEVSGAVSIPASEGQEPRAVEQPPTQPQLQQAEEKDKEKEEQRQAEEEKLREENRLAVKVMQKLHLGHGLAEPKGQKGGGDAEEASATALTPRSNEHQ